MSTSQTLEGLIITDPNLRGGRPIIAGTGVTVRTIVGHYKLGLTPEEIADDMALELAGVYAALAYYHLNRDEIEADILADSEAGLMQEAHRQQVRDLLVVASLGRAAAEKPAQAAPLSAERRAELAQRFSMGRPLSDVIIEEREDY
jgi:uncharacterized protein (DUF433 family)